MSRENLKIEFREKHQYSYSLPITSLRERYEDSLLSYYFELLLFLTLFFPIFPFDPPENIRKPNFSDVFRGIKKDHWKENAWTQFLSKTNLLKPCWSLILDFKREMNGACSRLSRFKPRCIHDSRKQLRRSALQQ